MRRESLSIAQATAQANPVGNPSKPGSSDLLFCFYGDDFTGSTDSLESLSKAGVRAALFIQPPTVEQLARYPGLQAIGVAGMTRSMDPVSMEAVLRPAFKTLGALGARHVNYKICSTFDSSPTIGSIGRVIDLAVDLFHSPFVPLLVAAPKLGRYCVFGNLFARLGQEGEAYRLDRHPSMSKHPITPADESDLRRHLGRQTSKRIGLFDILKVGLPLEEAHVALETLVMEGAEIVLFDTLYQEQLCALGGLIDGFASKEQPLFSVGSSAMEAALGAYWASEGLLGPLRDFPEPGRVEPLLVVSGSCSPVTAKQIDWALANGFAEVRLNTVALAAEDNSSKVEYDAAQAVIGLLNNGRSVIVHTSRGTADPRFPATAAAFARRGLDAQTAKTVSGKLFGGALGRVVRQAAGQTELRRLVIAGGDTSGYVAQALGVEALEMIAPLSPGAPLCKAHAPGSPADGLQMVFKGGQVGSKTYFAQIAQGSVKKTKAPQL